MLNFNDMFMIKNIGNFNIYATIIVFIFVLLIVVSHVKFGTDKDITFLLLVALALASVGTFTTGNRFRDVYVALEDQSVKTEHVLEEEEASVESVKGKYYFRCSVIPTLYTTSEELRKRVQEEYTTYLEKNKLVKDKNEYQNNLQDWEKKGKDTNAVTKG